MVVTTWTLAQNAPPTPWLDSLGPYMAFGGLAILALWWLARQLIEERRANQELSDRLVSMAERVVPVLEAACHALRETEHELRHHRSRP